MKDRLRLVRKNSRLTQAEFAAVLGVGRDAIASYELGRVMPTKAYLILVSKEFGVNIQWLSTGDGEPYERGLVPQLVHVLRIYPALRTALERVVDVMTPEDWAALNALVEKTIQKENSPEP